MKRRALGVTLPGPGFLKIWPYLFHLHYKANAQDRSYARMHYSPYSTRTAFFFINRLITLYYLYFKYLGSHLPACRVTYISISYLSQQSQAVPPTTISNRRAKLLWKDRLKPPFFSYIYIFFQNLWNYFNPTNSLTLLYFLSYVYLCFKFIIF